MSSPADTFEPESSRTSRSMSASMAARVASPTLFSVAPGPSSAGDSFGDVSTRMRSGEKPIARHWRNMALASFSAPGTSLVPFGLPVERSYVL
ncbi:hypothetical protein BE08_22320 [Sorangium cellulosum]|uniref:Uncharacterized protein n=1 Tax=Sorangium cellulosum TaxID=56 RepID=A0A150P6A0_SORCE|nr:hypothetical protein BE08_22320 [Sorangium cellulosum]